jgi:hypothetical protein
MTKLVQNDIASLTNEQSALAALNSNYSLLENFSDTVLSRDGTSPNQMNADLDMNSNQILNIGDPLDMNGARIVGLDDGVDLDEPATVNQLNNAIINGGGVPSTVSMVTVNTEATLLNSRKLAVTGAGVSLVNSAGNITIDLDNDLDAIAGLATTGLATRTASDTWTTRTLQPPAAGITITNPAGIAGDPTLVLANDLAALEAMSGTGIAVHTGTSTWTERSLTQPAAGITISNNTGVAGNPTFALANDLNAVEGLSANGLAARTATDTWAVRTLTQPAAGITVTNGDGVSGNPTLALANDLNAVEGLASNGMVARTATDTWTTRTITGTANEITLTNGDGVSGAPTISIPASVTFTGKTITGGTYSSPSLSSPTITGTEDVQQNIQWSGDISPASFGTQQDNYSPAGLSTASTLRLTASAPADVTGLAGGADGRILVLHNIGASTITLKDESASSTAANRFALTTDLSFLQDMMVFLQYDNTSQRWRCVSGGGGGGGGGAATSEPFVTIGNSGGLSAERALTAGSGITITDGGANSTVTITAPLASTSQYLTSGSGATYTTPTGARALKIRMIGGGSGGSAAATNLGSAGSTTIFNSINANGASAPTGTPANTNNAGGLGGTGGTGSVSIRLSGSDGENSFANGGRGAPGIFGTGSPRGSVATAGGTNAAANTGAGGSGARNAGANSAGGGAGEYVEFTIASPAASYTYTVGAGGAGGAAGTQAGGNGGSGLIIVTEYY